MPPKPPTLKSLTQTASHQGNPLHALTEFLEAEGKNETAGLYDKLRFVGYVLELGYDAARIITADKYKLIVGGIPRGSFLLMAPTDARDLPPHFTLLRVTGVSPTPLSQDVQRTYFELHKRSMPELDVWTQAELQWGALDCDVLGMFHPNPKDKKQLAFSGDVNNVVSAHRYKVFAPDEKLLDLIVNGMVKPEQRFEIGDLRTMECGLFSTVSVPSIPVSISMRDFRGCRTAMFGKTRLGKSNVVKLIAQGMLDATASDNSVGQLVFDVNGEYANDNDQDGNTSIRSANETMCEVYALVKRKETPSKPLRLNFYEQPDSCMEVIASMLALDNQTSNYIRAFAGVKIPAIGTIASLPEGEKARPIRKIQMYWAILHKAGFEADENRLRALGLVASHTKNFDPHFNQGLRAAAHQSVRGTAPTGAPATLDELVTELKVMAQFRRNEPNNAVLMSGSKPMFDPDDGYLLDFLYPSSGSGPKILKTYDKYLKCAPRFGHENGGVYGQCTHARAECFSRYSMANSSGVR